MANIWRIDNQVISSGSSALMQSCTGDPSNCGRLQIDRFGGCFVVLAYQVY